VWCHRSAERVREFPINTNVEHVDRYTEADAAVGRQIAALESGRENRLRPARATASQADEATATEIARLREVRTVYERCVLIVSGGRRQIVRTAAI
jgi:hypothetical protein